MSEVSTPSAPPADPSAGTHSSPGSLEAAAGDAPALDIRHAERIFIISDSTGETAQRVVRASLIQFSRPDIEILTFSRIRRPEDLQRVFERAQRENALVVYTLVDSALRSQVTDLAGKLGVLAIDPIEPLMAKLAQVLGREPAGRPGALQSIDQEYFRRIEAVEFAVKHDDGQMPQGLKYADLVMVGISRTSKTPLCTYLAQKGWKVANVPIVLGIPLPRELFEIPQDRIYGLTIDLASLVRIRRARLKQLNMPLDSDYGMKEHIVKELKYAWELFRGNPKWPIVDVSLKAIEETTSIILWMHQARRARGYSGDEPDEFAGLYPA